MPLNDSTSGVSVTLSPSTNRTRSSYALDSHPTRTLHRWFVHSSEPLLPTTRSTKSFECSGEHVDRFRVAMQPPSSSKRMKDMSSIVARPDENKQAISRYTGFTVTNRSTS